MARIIRRRRKRSKKPAGGTTIDFNYANYDKVGNRLSLKIGTANAQVYDYDKLYQLTAVDYNDGNSADYDYDKLGNRRAVVNGGTTAYTSNAINQYETVAGTNCAYDKNGNLTSDGQYTYIYDCENRLLGVKQGETTIVSYAYDYRGRRVARTTGTTTITYLYDGDQVISDYTGSTVKKRYYYGMGIDQPICFDTISGSPTTLRFYYYDGLGSVVALAGYTGTISEKYTYDVYGNPTTRNAQGVILPTSDVNNRYMFTGREYDPCVGIYYYRARFYSPNLGRFLQTDPIGYYDSMNLYQYCLNNPLNFIDPYGENFFGGVVSLISGNGFDTSHDMGWSEAGQLGSAAGRGALDGGQIVANEATFGATDALGLTHGSEKVSEYGKVGQASKIAADIGRDAIMTAAGMRAAAWFGKTRAGYALNHNRYLRIGPGNIPNNRPFTYGSGQNIPTMRIGNGAPTWYNHFDLRFLGY